MKVGLLVWLCKKPVDTEIMIGILKKAGLNRHTLDQAEIIIINTCGFITEARRNDQHHYKTGNKEGKGCLNTFATGF